MTRISVTVSDNFDRALTKFKRKVKAEGIVDECKRREFYESPSTIKQRERKSARRRWLKKVEASKPTKR